MTTEHPDLTLDEVRERIRVARVPIPEARVAMVHGLLKNALAPVRAFDANAALTLEPAPTFDAAALANRHGQR